MSRADIGGRELDRFLVCVLDVISVNGESGVCVGMSGLFLRAIGIRIDDVLIGVLDKDGDFLCLAYDLNGNFVDVDR
jgi:hypothetical protein